MRSLWIIILSFFTLSACSQYEEPEDGFMDKQYFVKTEGIALPVRVAGRESSKIALIMTHGGPGGSSQTFRLSTGVRTLENFYKVIYWDQRASGTTQGNSKPEDINIDQYSRDLDAIVEFTRQVVGAESIFLLGHSWGGGLTAFYLQANPLHQEKLKGYISVCPAYNVVDGLGGSRQWVINGAVKKIAAGQDVAYWQKALQFYQNNPKILASNFVDHAAYLGKLDGGIYNKNFTRPKSYFPAFESQAFLSNPFFVGNNMVINGESIYAVMDLTSGMNKITLPTLLIWGDKDGLLPPDKVPNYKDIALADVFMSSIGTPGGQKQFIRYLNSAHEPMAEEGAKFAADVRNFMEKYK
jgi:pimeloyl-ACP methyl ester carboxylesterase